MDYTGTGRSERLRDLSDADFQLELGRVQEYYDRANRIARGAAPTLQVMQQRWDAVNHWHAKLNELMVEQTRRGESDIGRWLDQEIGI